MGIQSKVEELYERNVTWLEKFGTRLNVTTNLASAAGAGAAIWAWSSDLGKGVLAMVIAFALIVYLPMYQYVEEYPGLLRPWSIKTRLGFAVRIAGWLGWPTALYLLLAPH